MTVKLLWWEEVEHILNALAVCETLQEAAEKLGIDPATLYRKRRLHSDKLNTTAVEVRRREIARRKELAEYVAKNSSHRISKTTQTTVWDVIGFHLFRVGSNSAFTGFHSYEEAENYRDYSDAIEDDDRKNWNVSTRI